MYTRKNACVCVRFCDGENIIALLTNCQGLYEHRPYQYHYYPVRIFKHLKS